MGTTQVKAVIVGAAGYGGAELATILLRHPHATIAGLFGSGRREQVEKIADLFPRLAGRIDMEIRPVDLDAVAALKPDAIFLATPHEASVELAPAILTAAPKTSGWKPTVFDLSGGFRLPAALYPPYYGFEHHEPKWLDRAVYGLPELNRSAIAETDLVAVPGCYPTSAILPLAPLAKAGAVRPGTRPIIDSTSGVSGAGRTPSAKTHLCEVSLQPYNVLKHRHNPEIDRHAGTPVVFTPHLGAYDRGILSTIHVELEGGWDLPRVSQTLKNSYSREPFVRLLPADRWPSVAGVKYTNFCDIGWAVDEASHHLILVSAIDNLVKGAAGQAVQCMNIRFRLPETVALLEGTA